jgi:hypothetical protein
LLVPNRAQFPAPDLIRLIDDPMHVPPLVASARAAEVDAARGVVISRSAVAVGVVIAAGDAGLGFAAG